jgi:hypothetical protein
VHKIPTRVQCTVQVGELDVSNLHSPPYRSRQIIGLSHSESVRLPLQLPMRPSPHQLHAGPGLSTPCTRARHSSTDHRTLCAVHGLCTSALEAWMFVCVYSVFVLSCVSSGLATGLSLVQGVLPIVCKCKITEPHKRRPRPDMGWRAIE